MLDPWLPVGHELPDGATAGPPVHYGSSWQIVGTRSGGRALLAEEHIAERWVDSGLLDSGSLQPFRVGATELRMVSTGVSQVLAPVADGPCPRTKAEGMAFSLALAASRAIDGESPFQDGIYLERLSRILPTYGITTRTEDDVVLGFWLTGGVAISVKSFRRLHRILSRWEAHDLKEVIEAAGFRVTDVTIEKTRPHIESRPGVADGLPHELLESSARVPAREFTLPGRPKLAAFFNEHVVDVVTNAPRYQALGVSFPSAIILHGPPGTGKTFAVDRLVEFLGWPSFEIDATSVGSPYIHETSRKVAQVFDQAIEASPSVLVIDEMESFLAQRDMGGGHHRVEEVAEFLRRIPQAGKEDVLVIAMTNRIDMVDEAILRRGRFDHVIEVGFPSEEEILSLLKGVLSDLPLADDVAPAPLAKQLSGRSLSDVAFVVRESARLAARAGKRELDQESLEKALSATPARGAAASHGPRIGFA